MNGQNLSITPTPSPAGRGEEEGTTMRLYHPLTSYDEAVARGDEVAMKQCFDEITFYEQRIREQAQMVRKHLVEKALAGEGGQHG